jgi:formylmethanofuran dehydrogenase subunit E
MEKFHQNDSGIHAELEKLGQDNSRRAENFESRIESLEKKYSKLADLTEALWHIVRESLELNDELLRNKIVVTMEKKAARKTARIQCAKCQQNSPINKGMCIYCGTAFINLPAKDLFDF